MAIRQTRLEYTNKIGRGPKVSVSEFMAKVKRLMKRRMAADGVLDKSDDRPRFDWQWSNDAGTVGGTVQANTRGEARAQIKKVLGGPIPPGYITIEKVNADSTGSARAA